MITDTGFFGASEDSDLDGIREIFEPQEAALASTPDSIPCHCGYFRDQHRAKHRIDYICDRRRCAEAAGLSARVLPVTAVNRMLPNGEAALPSRVRNWVSRIPWAVAFAPRGRCHDFRSAASPSFDIKQ